MSDNNCQDIDIDINNICIKFINDNNDNIWIIKVLFSGIMLLLLIFYYHYWMAIQKKVDFGLLAKELLTEKHKTITLETKILILKKELINSSNHLLTLERSLILNGTIQSIEHIEMPLDGSSINSNNSNNNSTEKLEKIDEDKDEE